MRTFFSVKNLPNINASSFFVMILLTVFGFVETNAQCPQSLGCNDDIQISLDYECYAVITPELILEDERTGCDYIVTIMTANDFVLDQTTYTLGGDPLHPVIDGSYIGTPYKASISFVDPNGTTISCWGWFSVEDKLPPLVTCIDDITVDCSKDMSGLFTSMGNITYCSDPNPMDTDMNPGTITLLLNPLTGSGSTMPWEVIDYLDIDVPLVPFTGSGTGTIVTDGGSYDFSEDPVDNSMYTGEISGVQATEDNISPTISIVIRDTPANQAAIAPGLCVDINTVSFFKYQQEDNCDPDVEVILNKDEIQNLECTTGDFTARRDIEYYTKDHVGLSADVCDFSIYFEKRSIDDLEFPTNVFFDCDDPLINVNGKLDLGPDNTGQPTIDGLALTDDNNLCRINVSFNDDTFNLCGINTIKILRRWTVLDWCEGEYAQSYQTIKVEDKNAPEIECPDDGLKFYANNDCEGDVIFRPFDENDVTGLKSFFDCASLSVRVEYLKSEDYNPLLPKQVYTPADPIGNNVYRAMGLQNGLNYIKYIVTDDCDNSSECVFEIIIEDEDRPYAICDQFTAVSLANNGWGRVYAISVDDGSYDECGGPVTLDIRRDSSACENLPEYEGDDLQFGDYVQFCCQEAGQTIPVIMRVTDQGGKSNICIVNVIVQDKTGIDIESCPDQLVFNLECDQISQIDTSLTGSPVINGDCSVGIIRFEDSGSIADICGNGTIIRRWFVDLPGNTIELTSCEQVFNFTSDVVLTINSFEWPQDREDATCENYSTDLGDAVLYGGVPVNKAPVCAHLSYSFKDRVFENVEGYCLKIIRTWTVIDFCQYNASTSPDKGIWFRTQVIKVSNSEGPTLTECPQDTVLPAASSDCYQIINFNPPKAFDNCENSFIHPSLIQYSIRRNGAIIKTGFGPISNDTLSSGNYLITWFAEGVCSTVSSCSHQLQIRDDKAPSPYCRSGITTALQPPINSNQEPFIEIWAIDFDLGSSDNCDATVELSFDQNDLSIKSLTFTCSNIGANEITMWVTDDMGNQDYCRTILNIQANGNICPDTSGMMIAGHIETEFEEMLENVEVGLQTMLDASMNYDFTNINGEYTFPNMGSYLDYSLTGISADDYLNGVSTLDLIIIQRHILGLEEIESPYQIIASDVNSSNDVSALDLIELRKLILGIYEELPSNDSWRFVDKSFKFTDPTSPWPFKESIDLYDLNGNDMDNDFIAVKVGDVNNSVIVNSTMNSELIERRSQYDDVLITHDILQLSESGEYMVPFYFKTNESMLGMQLFLEYDSDQYEIANIESGRLKFDSDSYVISNNDISIVWYSDKAIKSEGEDALFYIILKTKQMIDSEIFSLASDGKNSELYEQSFNTRNILLERQVNNFENKLFQNVPNPFSSLTTIDFELSRESDATLNIFDTNGKLIKSFSGKYNSGLNSIIVRNDELNGNGIYYYQLESESFSSTRKMIFIE